MQPQTTTGTHTTHDHHILSPPRPVLIGVGVVLLWVALVAGSDELWRHAFGFSAGDALALAVGLDAYLAMVVAVLAGAAFILGHER